jgi:hypothetical protein
VHNKNMLDDYGQKWFHTLEQLETNRLFALARNPELESIAPDPGISTSLSVRSMPTVSLPLTKALADSSSPSPSLRPKLTGDQAARPPRPNPKSRHHSKWRPLLPHALKRAAVMVVRLTHPQLPPSRQLPSSHERLRTLKCSFFSGKKEHTS